MVTMVTGYYVVALVFFGSCQGAAVKLLWLLVAFACYYVVAVFFLLPGGCLKVTVVIGCFYHAVKLGLRVVARALSYGYYAYCFFC